MSRDGVKEKTGSKQVACKGVGEGCPVREIAE